MGTQTADVVIVGLGAVGSATIYQLAKFDLTVTGIDRFSPPHALGSTHGDTRITRRATGEGEEFVPLVSRSHEIWREIEAAAQTELFTACGCLILEADSIAGSSQHGAADFLNKTVAIAQNFEIEHEVISGDEIRSRFPQFHLNEEHRGYYEPEGGFVRPEAAVAAQLELARGHKGTLIQRNERAIRVDATSSGVTVQTDRAMYSAGQAVIAAGPWVGELAGSADISRLCTVYPQALHWFALDSWTESMTAAKMPAFVWAFGSAEGDMFYGFPAIDGPGGGLKVATEQHSSTGDPDEPDRVITAEDSLAMFDHYVAGRLPLRRSVVKAARCWYTMAPQSRFIIDRHPQHDNVLIASPCSGHGFKHSAAIGEALARLLAGAPPRINLLPFGIEYFPGVGRY